MFFGHFLEQKQGGWSTPPGFDQISLNLKGRSFGQTPSNWPSFIEIGSMACAAPAWSFRGCTHKVYLELHDSGVSRFVISVPNRRLGSLYHMPHLALRQRASFVRPRIITSGSPLAPVSLPFR